MNAVFFAPYDFFTVRVLTSVSPNLATNLNNAQIQRESW